jgi:hypothetical protein
MELINPTTGQTITPGAKIHTVPGGEAWHFAKIVHHPSGEHRVHCTKIVKGSKGRHFRGHREFHPHAFGLEIKIDITWQRHAMNTARHAFSKVDDYLMAGVFAIVPLAFFEHYHMAGPIIGTVTLGVLSGGGN